MLEYIGNIVTPETEGIQPLPPICSREHGEEISALEPIPDRVDLVTDMTTRWLRLRHLANADKKLALFVYNFPPGPGNVGAAYFLDVAASVRSMIEALGQAGYVVGELDADDKATSVKLQGMYAGEHHVGVVSAGEIRDWVHDLPADREALFYEAWGQPPLTLPVKGLRYGNVLVLLQDMRGMEDLTVIHDKKAPPSPWLLASYRYATRRFNADAIVHVGTHGLVEWSRGKSGLRGRRLSGVSGRSFRTPTSSTCSIRSKRRSRGAAPTRRSYRTSARRCARLKAAPTCATSTGSCTTTTTP